jgi:hypothetical protein
MQRRGAEREVYLGLCGICDFTDKGQSHIPYFAQGLHTPRVEDTQRNSFNFAAQNLVDIVYY